MKNKEKFEQLEMQIKELQKRYEQEAKAEVKNPKKLAEKLLIIKEIEFPATKPYFDFFSQNQGDFRQLKQNRRKQIQAVSICFFVTLYEQDLIAAFQKDIQIPYTLRGFWKMQLATKLVEDLIHLQNECQQIILWELRKMNKEQKDKVNAYRKIIEEFASIRFSSDGWKDIVTYKEMQFKLNKKNVKLDVVPFCKLLTIYYVGVLKRIDAYIAKYATNAEREKLENVKNRITKFMENYFVQRVF